MVNRLGQSLSPYLRQHADNPVDWWPWSTAAFDEARERDVPVLLSVGYASCHWCHVMAHESFEDPDTAAVMNERFVSIKVDREERPDIDAVYMAATQAVSGSGGWPMTVFVDHDGRAFMAGTYYPRESRRGLPAFTDVLIRVSQVWHGERGRIEDVASQVQAALDGGGPPTSRRTQPELGDITKAIAALDREFDPQRGGFGGAPKFPPAMTLEFLLRADALLRMSGRTDVRPLRMVATTLTAMARGGIFDQLAGGFARYSVDANWVVPHFEKMLYDNALLLRVYTSWWRATGDPMAERVVRQTATFLIDELRTEEGGFASSLDADSDGREGAAYVWTPSQLVEVLGAEDAAWVGHLCAVSGSGTFEAGESVLQLPADPPDPTRWARCREELLRARRRREQPPRDDKVVTAWNGLGVAALAQAGALFDEPDWIAAACAAADWLVDQHWDPTTGELARTSLGGTVSRDAPGVLEDYADLAEGLLALFQVTGENRWFTTSRALADSILAEFDDGEGGFFDSSKSAPALVRRPRDPTDGVTPAGASASAHVLLTLGALTGEPRYLEAADAALGGLMSVAAASPRFAGWTLATATAALAGPVQVGIVLPQPGASDGQEVPMTSAGRDLYRVALTSTSPGLVVVVGEEGRDAVPLLAGRPAHDGTATAYPCRGFVCELPVTSPDELREVLQRQPGAHRS